MKESSGGGEPTEFKSEKKRDRQTDMKQKEKPRERRESEPL